MTAPKRNGNTVKTSAKLTKEQQQYIAEMLAEMLQENATEQKPTKKRALPLTDSDTRSFRLPITLIKNIDALTAEVNSTQGYVFWHLFFYALSGIRTAEYLEIAETQSFKSLRKKLKDESCPSP